MLRGIIAKALPTVSTVVTVLQVRERKGWVWAAVAGLGAHVATDWLTNLVITSLEAGQTLPSKSVEVADEQVVIPDLKEPPVPGPSSNAIDGEQTLGKLAVIDKHNNVIQLPKIMGEP